MEKDLRESLFALQDPEYRALQCKLMPTVDPDRVVGVRIPALRKLAKEFSKTPEAEAFMLALPHRYYDEDNVHGCLISFLKDYDQAVAALDAFLPHVDNWATCDLIRPAAFRKHPEPLLVKCREWMASDHVYTIRFGIGMLMTYYLDEAFSPEQLDWVATLRSDEYYVNMMIAWYFATALAKQYDAALPYIREYRMDPWTHDKAIQKAVESYRVSPEHKARLREYKTASRRGVR